MAAILITEQNFANLISNLDILNYSNKEILGLIEICEYFKLNNFKHEFKILHEKLQKNGFIDDEIENKTLSLSKRISRRIFNILHNDIEKSEMIKEYLPNYALSFHK